MSLMVGGTGNGFEYVHIAGPSCASQLGFTIVTAGNHQGEGNKEIETYS